MQEVAQRAQEIVSLFEQDNADVLDAEVHHIGATAMRFGHTMGDVDVNVRVEEVTFTALVNALRWDAKNSFLQELLLLWRRDLSS